MGNQLLGLTDPYGLRRREPVSLPEMSLEWGLDPVGTGLDAINLADAVRQYSVGLGGDLPPETAFSDKPIRLPESLGGAAADLKAQQLANVKRALIASAGEPAVGPTLRELEGKNRSPGKPGASKTASEKPKTTFLGSSSSTSSGIKVDPEQVRQGQAKIDQGAAGLQGAADEESEAAEERIAARNEAAARADADIATNEIGADTDIEIARQERDAYTAELQQAVADAKEEVNPDHWWGTRGMGQKIAIVAASMLGGFTEGFTWGKVKNRALDMIENAIDRDIRAQEQSINAARAKRGEMRGLVGILDSKLKDLELAKSAYRASVYEQLGRQFEVMSQNSRDLTVAKKSKVVASELQMRAGEAQKDFAVKTADHWQKTSGGHQVLVPPALANTAPQKAALAADEYVEQVRNTMASFSDHNKAIASLNPDNSTMGAIGSAIASKMPVVQTDAKVVEANRQRLAARIAKGEGVGQLAVDERKTWAESLVGPTATQAAKIRGVGGGYKTILTGIQNRIKKLAAQGDAAGIQKLRGLYAEAQQRAASDLGLFGGRR